MVGMLMLSALLTNEIIFNSEIAICPEHQNCIGFSDDGQGLEIRDAVRLSSDILPRYFKHNNVSSFIRQLNNYGFRTKPSNFGATQTFVHEYFQRDRNDLLDKISRRTGQKRTKKKSLYDQVSELKKREIESSKKLEDFTGQIKSLKEQNEALLQENMRLHAFTMDLWRSNQKHGQPMPAPLLHAQHSHQSQHSQHHQQLQHSQQASHHSSSQHVHHNHQGMPISQPPMPAHPLSHSGQVIPPSGQYGQQNPQLRQSQQQQRTLFDPILSFDPSGNNSDDFPPLNDFLL